MVVGLRKKVCNLQNRNEFRDAAFILKEQLPRKLIAFLKKIVKMGYCISKLIDSVDLHHKIEAVHGKSSDHLCLCEN